ncbi:endo-alpha-N-acetylgalactosaminidase family protein [Pseudalkalibacillus decolorationis]|uniref:endo-alpha-N-acetylgalactosaminidase family protein n=1 Tax=Pseudalkalibacillus decolorationis TaxID=163879 RepID=UPI0021496EBC|nr:endo-alpha-N-acetylgalactosaminidase family protein [Pseudalkalibacillus decolorationis]
MVKKYHSLKVVLGIVFAWMLVVSSVISGLAVNKVNAEEDVVTIQSSDLSVQVDKQFPRVIQYTWNSNGAVLYGQSDQLSKVMINGKNYEPDVKSEVAGDAVMYHMQFPEIDVEMDVKLEVTDNILSFKVTKIEENGKTKVETLAIPDHSIVSVKSSQSGAQLSSATLLFKPSYGDYPSIDEYKPIKELPLDDEANGVTMAILNTDSLATAISTNALAEQERLVYKTTDEGEQKQTGLWSGEWTYRGANGEVVGLPYQKVAVTPDQNRDGQVDWQDGAIAFRDIMFLPKGSEEIKDDVINQISFNIASQPTHPFLRTLDEIKKSYLYTDGLGQSILLKGYQSQGHDSAHPDYGDNYNKGAGGLEDLKYLVEKSKKYNVNLGVHINQQEMYPEAKNFRWDLTKNAEKGWQWMDQSYHINQHEDVEKGYFQERLRELKKDVPGLSWVYVDVYFDRGWYANEVTSTIQDAGWGVHTEWIDYMWPNALYYHQSNQYDQLGVNSQILRFTYNEYKDVWKKKGSMLKGSSNLSFMGWMGQNNILNWSKSVFTQNLPTKYMQHFPIMKWSDHRIDFKDNVYVTDQSGTLKMYKDDKLIMDGDNLFLAWNPKKETKIYHWNPAGGETSWSLPDSWEKEKKVVLYKLTGTGKQFVKKLSVKDGEVTIQAEKEVPYVIYPHPVKGHGHTKKGDQNTKMDWGAGGIVNDPHFFSHSFKQWKRFSTTGDVSDISIVDGTNGYENLQFAGTSDGMVSQRIEGLEPGNTYSASVWVEVTGKRKAVIGVKDYGGSEVTNWTDVSPAEQYTASNPRRHSNFQRMKVLFTVPEDYKSGSATLYLKAAEGGSGTKVQFADVRVVENNGADLQAKGHYYHQDFENVDQGWGPFVYARNSGDPTIHLSELHKGYTRDTISGRYSLKILDAGKGMQIRTLGQTLRLKPNHTYRIGFDYQADTSGMYNFVVQSDKEGTRIVNDTLVKTTNRPLDSAPPTTLEIPKGWTDSLPPQYSAPHKTYEQTITTGGAGCGDYFIAVTSPGGSGALTIDNLVVDDLGPAKEIEECPTNPTGELKLESEYFNAGKTSEVTGTFTNYSSKTIDDVDVELKVPEEWSVKATSDTKFQSVEPGQSVSLTWAVTPNESASADSYTLGAKASFKFKGYETGTTATKVVNILPDPPQETTYISDLDWLNASNGWGPVERDISNGGQGSGDGQTLTINGETFEKGLGVHANSEVVYFLDGNASSFQAKVGVDDEMLDSSAASIVFQVWGDGKKLYDSGLMTAEDDAKNVDVNIEGVENLKLVVTDSGNGVGSDHGDWGAAKVIVE